MFFKVVYRVNDADKKVLTIAKSCNRVFRAMPDNGSVTRVTLVGFRVDGRTKVKLRIEKRLTR